ncbi:PDR/VanB family oxidoreductase [Glaciimonas sp. PCH181]|uniref:PDR/VanB family oxidoreductase n=1 Tax=Glaciimonas sp. PCH181 TaxID=2133943 RepID=UPI000D37C691|nr:PDR/VanB family oxidoreductase [Glaciimonas sp. PCH181]PUA17751.1 ferredoxin--NADP(+) reductase [Glaciimonas sp. PCH181]
MTYQKTLHVRVVAVNQASPEIRHFVLESLDGADLPHFSGGSHVVVIMRHDGHTYKNPYSLMGDGYHSRQYHIGVRREAPSRGGSHFMHDNVKPGDMLELMPPANLFMIDTFARKHLLIAGGIGITPIRSMIFDLKRSHTDFDLHYCVRNPEHAAFWDDLEEECGPRAKLHTGENRLDIPGLLRSQPSGTHVYVCGPQRMVEGVRAVAADIGWSPCHVHHEEFSHATGGAPFDVLLASSGRKIPVAHNQTLLEALEDAGLEPAYMCRGGVCGACETAVIDGQIDHRDHFLTNDEKAGMQKMMICVSRGACGRIVVDL